MQLGHTAIAVIGYSLGAVWTDVKSLEFQRVPDFLSSRTVGFLANMNTVSSYPLIYHVTLITNFNLDQIHLVSPHSPIPGMPSKPNRDRETNTWLSLLVRIGWGALCVGECFALLC